MIPALKSETKFNLTIEEIEEIRNTRHFTEFDLKRFEKVAENIKNTENLAEGFSILGMVACLRHNLEEMKKCFNIAIQQSGRLPLHIANYAMSLVSVGLYEEANRYAQEAFKSDPQFPHCLHAIIVMSCLNNDKKSFRTHTNQWFKRNRREHILKTMPLRSFVNTKLVNEFMVKHTVGNIPQGHIPPNDVIEHCQDKLMSIFRAPLNIVFEIMPDLINRPTLVAWIQWTGDPEEGLAKYDLFENWYIENDYDISTWTKVFRYFFAIAP